MFELVVRVVAEEIEVVLNTPRVNELPAPPSVFPTFVLTARALSLFNEPSLFTVSQDCVSGLYATLRSPDNVLHYYCICNVRDN